MGAIVPPISKTAISFIFVIVLVFCELLLLAIADISDPAVETAAGVPAVIDCLGNLMRKIFVPIVGTECDTLVTDPNDCKLVNKCVLPDRFGPKHRHDILLLPDIVNNTV